MTFLTPSRVNPSKIWVATLLAMASVSAWAVPRTPVVLYADVQIDADGATDNSISVPNTSRKLAVGADGKIYALYHGSNGLRIARSDNRGQSFGASVQINASNVEGEVAVASTGYVYVVYVSAGTAYVVQSSDLGVTFSTPVAVGTGFSSAHMATDGRHVYVVPQSGTTLYSSSDDGATFTGVSLGSSWVFSDVMVNPTNHEVVVQVDDPSVNFYKSSDYGATFSAASPTGKSVYFSVGGISASPAGNYLFTAGSGTNLEKIDLNTGTAAPTITVSNNASSNGRSLQADIYQNVVLGFSNGNDVLFEHSNDLAASLGSAITVATGTTQSGAGINTTNGDILFIYDKAGHVYLSTYKDGLVGYDLQLSLSSVVFFNPQGVGTTSSSQAVVVSNTGSSNISINGIAANGPFAQTNNCPATLNIGASCTINITFSPTQAGPAAGNVTIDAGAAGNRVIGLSGTGEIAALPPSATTNAASGVSHTGATLNGTVNDNNQNTTTSFDYGLTNSYGTNVAATTGGSISAGSGATPVAVTVNGLACGNTYHFRVVAVNSQGTTNGNDQSFNTAACTTPTLNLGSNVSPAVYGQGLTLTASVSGPDGTATGTVSFYDGANLLGSVSLSGGSASLAIGNLGVGSHSITAVYSGDNVYAGGTTAPFTQTINKRNLGLQITGLNPSAPYVGQTLTVKTQLDLAPAPVPPTAAHGASVSLTPPSGVITVVDGNQSCSFTLPATMCSVPLNNQGSHSVMAYYSGDSNYQAAITASPSQVNVVPGAMDVDGDGLPDNLEGPEALNVNAKDNNILANTTKGKHLFVMQQYRDLLFREGSPSALSSWESQMANGMSRNQLIQNFIASVPANTQIKPLARLFTALFGGLYPNASINGFVGYAKDLSNKYIDLAGASTKLVTSSAFVGTFGNPSDADFAANVLNNVLGRAPTMQEMSDALTAISNTSRAAWLKQQSELPAFVSATENKIFFEWVFLSMGRKVPSAQASQYWMARFGADGPAARIELVDAFLGTLLPNYSGAATGYYNRFMPALQAQNPEKPVGLP